MVVWVRRCAFWLAFGMVVLSFPKAGAADQDWAAFEIPGAFAIMRHALAPGGGDPRGFDVADCATQRNLDARGRAQAKRIGDAFKARGISVTAVLTSQWCRCRDTARLLDLGSVTEIPAFNSFFADRSTESEQSKAAHDLLRDVDQPVMVVTHQVNISALTGRFARSGEVLVVRHAGSTLEVLGSIMIDP